MNNKEILSFCIEDRNYVYKDSNKFFKISNIDLLIKLCILLLNLIGIKIVKKNNQMIVFIDEIKNTNMHNNLIETYEKIAACKKILNFYTLNCKNHLKIGLIFPILSLMVLLLIVLLLLPLLIINIKLFSKCILLICYYTFSKVLNKIYSNEIKYVVMSDHHFFSTICSCQYNNHTFVIQHGLVMDKNMYYPIRAGHFLAWGENSKNLLENDPKIMVTGTYKFSNFNLIDTDYHQLKNNNRKVMFLISSLNVDEIERKIDVLIELSEILKFELIIKCHPGSLFDLNYWKKKYSDKNIVFYKEEQVCDLDFDYAISENSTVNIDLLILKKRFIIFDSRDGYFGKYFSIIPNGNDSNSIMQCIQNINNYDFNKINKLIIKNELNDNKCYIKTILEDNNK